jgi:hypothetical protein
MLSSPWLAVTRSGVSVHASTRAIRRCGLGSASADVVREIDMPSGAPSLLMQRLKAIEQEG